MCWIICDSASVRVTFDHLCLCTSAELLTLRYTQTKGSASLAADAQSQQGFIDERASFHNPTHADSPRITDEDEGEDERHDGMSEPTQITRTEKRKVI